MKIARALLCSLLAFAILVAGFNTTVNAATSPAPTNVKVATVGSSSVKLTWTAVSGVISYQVYISISSTGTIALKGTSSSPTYTATTLNVHQ